MFSRLDRNSDGVIDKDEIPENLRQRIMNLDKNGDGKITKEEFIAGRSARPESQRPDTGSRQRPARDPNQSERQTERPNVARFQQLLQRADKNGNGKLELSELPEAMRERLSRFDANGDQVIEASEFGAAMQNREGRSGNQPDPNRRRQGTESERPKRGEGQPDAMARIQNMMKELPRDNSGNVDLGAIKDEGRAKRLAQFDTNGDQLLDGTELRAMAQKFRQGSPNQNAKPGDRSMDRKNERRPGQGSDRSPQRPKRPGDADKN
jgi:Ca2+-binding EF-hand superfamily protein